MLRSDKDTKKAATEIGAAARNTTDAPAAAPVAPQVQTKREAAAFHFPVVKGFTGRIQYAKNRANEAMTALGKSLRGEVHQVSDRQKRIAVGLVENGDFSHVAADTPLGQPEEFALTGKKQIVPGEPETGTASTVNTLNSEGISTGSEK
jgi:hypothetical protein